MFIDPAACTNCDACRPVCPVSAIFYEDLVPAKWRNYTALNAAFFTRSPA
jgi:ferredoxin